MDIKSLHEYALHLNLRFIAGKLHGFIEEQSHPRTYQVHPHIGKHFDDIPTEYVEFVEQWVAR